MSTRLETLDVESTMNILLRALIVVSLLQACGHSPESDVSVQSRPSLDFEQQFPNNSKTAVGSILQSSAIHIISAHLHVPTNNLYGNRIVVVQFSVPNLSPEKNVWIRAGTRWIQAAFTVPASLATATQTATIRWLGTNDERDQFELAVHDYVQGRLPLVELAVTQNDIEEKSRFYLRDAPLTGGHLKFAVSHPVNEINIRSIQIERDGAGTSWLRMLLDVADLSYQKQFVISVAGDAGTLVSPTLLAFDSQTARGSQRRISYAGHQSGRAQFEVMLDLGKYSSQDVQSIELAYYANASLGAPTYGNSLGIYGDRYESQVAIEN